MSFWRRRFEFKDEEYLRVLQAYPGEFLKEKFEFKDEEYLEFSKLTQVSS